MQYRIRVLVAIFVLICMPSASFAHSVYIFAWIDGSQICTESYFTQKNKVRGGEVLMQNSSGEILARGITSEDGVLCFPLPEQAQPLEFIVLAGAGHRGTYNLSESELALAINTKDEVVEVTAEIPQQNVSPVQELQTNAQERLEEVFFPAGSNEVQLNGISETRLRQIVREELQSQLSPMRQYMAEKLEDKTPGVREIVGGIGWLVGLGALGFWYSQRKKRQ